MIDLFAMLEGVRDNGGGQFTARCPAHDDRSPSLSVKLCDDGRYLLHCFAGCDVESIVASIGLALADLMPDRPMEHRVNPLRRKMPARDALISLDHEALVVAMIAGDVLEHRACDAGTWRRLAQAVSRIGRARDAVAPVRHRP